MKKKFLIGDKVEWTNDQGIKHTGTIIETCYDPVSMRTHLLIKLPSGQYVAKWDSEIGRVDDSK